MGWFHGNRGRLAHRCHRWDMDQPGETFQAEGTAGRKAGQERMAPPDTSWGGMNWEGKMSKRGGSRLVRSLRTGVEECRRTSPSLKAILYVFFLSDSRHFIQNLLSSFSFVVLSKVFIFLAFPSVCSYFLPFSAPSPPYSLASFPAFLSISFFMQLYLFLWHSGVILDIFSLPVLAHGCFQVQEEKYFCTCFTFKVWPKDG